jgi:hypothetical protein
MLRVANHADAQDRQGLRLARIVRSTYHRATRRWPSRRTCAPPAQKKTRLRWRRWPTPLKRDQG